jgi:hypothetical protein
LNNRHLVGVASEKKRATDSLAFKEKNPDGAFARLIYDQDDISGQHLVQTSREADDVFDK